MQKFIDFLVRIGKKLDPRPLLKLTRKQWLKIAAAFVVIYLVIFGVNVVALKTQIGGNDSRIGGLRSTVDLMSFNYNLASRILDGDLKSQNAVGRVGGFYLTEARFDQLATTDKKIRQSRGLPIAASNAKTITDAVLDRMLIEQLVGEFARDHDISADPAEVEKRIAGNLKTFKTVERLEAALKKSYNWTLPDFRYEIEYSVLKAKMEESLGGQKYSELAKGSLQFADTPKVKDYADHFARTHTNYLVSGGINTLAKRYLEL